MTIQICICDDNTALREDWGNQLKQLGLDLIILPLETDALAEAVQELEVRRAFAADNSKTRPKPIGDAVLDRVDVLIVDYDLLELDERSYLTGENVAYLARSFSTCGFIIAMNQFGTNPFDLTMKGHIESFADLNIGSEQLKNPNLWGRETPGFNPWHWPDIQEWLSAQRTRIDQVGEVGLDATIFSFLGFDNETVDTMPLSILEWITPRTEEKRLEDITFRDVVSKSPLGVREKDALYIEDTNCLDDSQLTRIVAARLFKWLDRMVLPCSDFLIDAPHLALKFPSLVGGKENVSAKRGVNLKAAPIEIGVNVSRFIFERSSWLSRPAWWMNKLRDYEELPEVANPWDVEYPEQVFCEDVSTFCEKSDARSFVAEIPTTAPQRWVNKNVQNVKYYPSVRFAL